MVNSELVWDKFSEKLKNFLCKRVNDTSIADDLLQEIFVKIHLKLHLLKDEKKLENWVFQIAYNQLNDYYKSNKKTLEYAVDEVDLQPNTEDKNHFESCLLPFIENLPEKYRESIVMSDMQGIKIKDIAHQLNISESGIKSRIQRGREMIKQHFVDCCHLHIDSKGKLKGEHHHSHESWNCADDSCLVHDKGDVENKTCN
jgi:RNA polymerase sigma-70 factor, ECF subfamily